MIDEFTELVRLHYGLEDIADPASAGVSFYSRFLDFTYIVQDETTVVGRIVMEIEAASGGAAKLSEPFIALESSRRMGGGSRIPLRFAPELQIRGGPQGAGGLGLFPGAIVAMRGKNGGGEYFLVSQILTVSIPIVTPDPDYLRCGSYRQ